MNRIERAALLRVVDLSTFDAAGQPKVPKPVDVGYNAGRWRLEQLHAALMQLRSYQWPDHGLREKLEGIFGTDYFSNALRQEVGIREYLDSASTTEFPGICRRNEAAIRELRAEISSVKCTASGATSASGAKPKKGEWRGPALMLLKKHPEWPDSRIAKEVGVNKSQLSRDKMFQSARRASRGLLPPRGSKDATGHVEAFDED